MKENNYEIVKFEDGDFRLDVRVSPNEDTVWLTIDEMSLLFEREYSNVRKHIINALDEKCLGSTVAKFAKVQIEGDREIKRFIDHYKLDVIISVGYRVKSKRGIFIIL